MQYKSAKKAGYFIISPLEIHTNFAENDKFCLVRWFEPILFISYVYFHFCIIDVKGIFG